jgi:hypothetical protein
LVNLIYLIFRSRAMFGCHFIFVKQYTNILFRSHAGSRIQTSSPTAPGPHGYVNLTLCPLILHVVSSGLITSPHSHPANCLILSSTLSLGFSQHGLGKRLRVFFPTDSALFVLDQYKLSEPHKDSWTYFISPINFQR